MGRELANVRSAADALAFVNAFGPLRGAMASSWRDVVLRLRPAPRHDVPRPKDGPIYTPVGEYLVEATFLGFVIDTETAVRRAEAGDTQAMSQLRNFILPGETRKSERLLRFLEHEREAGGGHTDLEQLVAEGRFGEAIKAMRLMREWDEDEPNWFDSDDRSVLIEASQFAAEVLNHGLREGRPLVYDRAHQGEAVPPGQLRIGILPDTLLEVCYLMVALMLSDKEPVARCKCGRVFVAQDARQKFCTPACASKARFQRFKAKHATAKKAKETLHRSRRRTNGQKTRTR